ncbi:TolB family protein [Streptomyces sp. NPDC002346]
MRSTRALAVIGISIAVTLPFLGTASALDLSSSAPVGSVAPGRLVVSQWTSDTRGTFEVNPKSGAVTKTLTTAGVDGVVSPDGSQVAFAGTPGCQPVNSCGGPTSLMVSAVGGADQRTLFTAGADEVGFTSLEFPDWAPDGQHIVFDSTQGMGWVKPDGTGFESLGPGLRPTFSPDGTQIAFHQSVEYLDDFGNTEYGTDLFVMNLATRQVSQLTTDHRVWNAPASWSPDGRHIIYPTDSGASVVDTTTGDSTPVISGLMGVSPVYSPDGSQIAYSASDPGTGQHGLYVADADDHNARMISDLPGTELTEWIEN